MQTWQYYTTLIPWRNMEEKLNRLGANGWELVHCERMQNSPDGEYKCIFKMPR